MPTKVGELKALVDRGRPVLVLVRHGQKRVGASLPDPPLSDLGRAQAEALAGRLSNHRFEALYASPRRRTMETAGILGARLGLQPIVDEGLREVRDGPAALLSLCRLASFAHKIDPSRPVLVVTHGGTLHVLLLALEGWRGLPQLWRRIPHCQPFAYSRKAGGLSLAGPLGLLFLGMSLALLMTPGPRPTTLTVASYAIAIVVYLAMARLTSRGHFRTGAILIAITALAAATLAFGPSPVANRKVTAFNAWAYELGSHLPAFISTPPHPNGAAGALVAATGLVAGMAVFSHGWRRYGAMLGAMVPAAAVLLTASRSGWVALVTALSFLAFLHGRRHGLVVLALSGSAIAAIVLGAGRPAPGNPSLISMQSLLSRSEQWSQTVALIAEHPVTGLGVGRFPAAYADAVAGSDRRAFKTPNNALLQIWSDAGLLGLIALGWIIVRFGRILTTLPLRQCRSPGWQLAGIASAIVGLSVHGILESNIVVVWVSGGGYVQLASPLPLALLGLLVGIPSVPKPRLRRLYHRDHEDLTLNIYSTISRVEPSVRVNSVIPGSGRPQKGPAIATILR